MNTLITSGKTGFVSGALIKTLEDRGNNVVYFGKDKLDVRKPIAISSDTIDMIIHTASIVSSVQALGDPHLTYETNVMGTVNVMEFARKNRIPVINFSSCKIEPNSRGVRGPYGASKIIAEEITMDYWKCYGVPSISLRPASIYGPTQDGTEMLGWMTWFVKAILNGEEININGTDELERDSIFIDDLVGLVLRIVDNFYEGCKGATYYEVGNPKDGVITLKDAIKVIEEHTGKKAKKINYTHYRKADPVSLIMSNADKTMNIWDWEPKVPVEDGLRRICDYYMNENSNNM